MIILYIVGIILTWLMMTFCMHGFFDVLLPSFGGKRRFSIWERIQLGACWATAFLIVLIVQIKIWMLIFGG